jgi:ferredoxin
MVLRDSFGTGWECRTRRKGGREMRVKVDEDVCMAAASCEDTCPEVFEVVDGVSTVKVDIVPPALEGKVREAVRGCPARAISITEE